MKKMILLSLLMVFITDTIFAQMLVGKKKKMYKTSSAQKQKTTLANTTSANSILLTNSNTYSAYSPSASTRLQISDPTVTALNQRASGANIHVSPTGIVGIPKGTYGYANGKIFLRTTTATSSGTSYGSGAVGTGTSINGIGTGESTVGVNGKSNYAGPWLWGTKQPIHTVPVKWPAKVEDNQ